MCKLELIEGNRLILSFPNLFLDSFKYYFIRKLLIVALNT